LADRDGRLGVLYNAAFTNQRADAAKWAETQYPELWAQLQKRGTTEVGLYKITRQLTP
jgi:hypothetical protein